MIGKGNGEKGVPWTPERIERLGAMWRDGASATKIADALGGITRNAVIGKLHRLDLRRTPKPSAPVSPAPSKPARRAAPARPKIAAIPATPIPIPKPKPKPKPERRPPLGKFTLFDLRDDTCRFPLAGYLDRPPYLYCGDRLFSGPYCERHARLCFPALARSA